MQTQTSFISARHNLTADGFRILAGSLYRQMRDKKEGSLLGEALPLYRADVNSIQDSETVLNVFRSAYLWVKSDDERFKIFTGLELSSGDVYARLKISARPEVSRFFAELTAEVNALESNPSELRFCLPSSLELYIWAVSALSGKAEMSFRMEPLDFCIKTTSLTPKTNAEALLALRSITEELEQSRPGSLLASVSYRPEPDKRNCVFTLRAAAAAGKEGSEILARQERRRRGIAVSVETGNTARPDSKQETAVSGQLPSDDFEGLFDADEDTQAFSASADILRNAARRTEPSRPSIASLLAEKKRPEDDAAETKEADKAESVSESASVLSVGRVNADAGAAAAQPSENAQEFRSESEAKPVSQESASESGSEKPGAEINTNTEAQALEATPVSEEAGEKQSRRKEHPVTETEIEMNPVRIVFGRFYRVLRYVASSRAGTRFWLGTEKLLALGAFDARSVRADGRLKNPSKALYDLATSLSARHYVRSLPFFKISRTHGPDQIEIAVNPLLEPLCRKMRDGIDRDWIENTAGCTSLAQIDLYLSIRKRLDPKNPNLTLVWGDIRREAFATAPYVDPSTRIYRELEPMLETLSAVTDLEISGVHFLGSIPGGGNYDRVRIGMTVKLKDEVKAKATADCPEFSSDSAVPADASDALADSEAESQSRETSAVSEQDSEKKAPSREAVPAAQPEAEEPEEPETPKNTPDSDEGRSAAEEDCPSPSFESESSKRLCKSESGRGEEKPKRGTESAGPVNPIPGWIRGGVRVTDNGLPRDLAVLMMLADPLSVAEAVTTCGFDLTDPQSFWDAVLECERRNVGRSETAPCPLP